jgi:hypothetical protein
MFITVKFEIFTAMTMKNAVFWDVALCRSCVNRRFGGTYCFYLQDRKVNQVNNGKKQAETFAFLLLHGIF